MHRVVFAIALLAGCKSEEITTLERVKQEICACKDVACGEAAMKKLPQKDHTSDHRSQQLAKDILQCLSKLYDDQRPTTDPDTDTGSGSGSGSAK